MHLETRFIVSVRDERVHHNVNVFLNVMPHATCGRSTHNHPQVVARNASHGGTSCVFCVLWGVSLRTHNYTPCFTPPTLYIRVPNSYSFVFIHLYTSRHESTFDINLVKMFFSFLQRNFRHEECSNCKCFSVYLLVYK